MDAGPGPQPGREYMELYSYSETTWTSGFFACHEISPESRETGYVEQLCISHKSLLCFFSPIHTSGCTY